MGGLTANGFHWMVDGVGHGGGAMGWRGGQRRW